MKKYVILVTGASSGIGKACAKQLILDGHCVYAAARRVERMVDLEAMGATTLSMDMLSESEMKAAVDRIILEQGKVDVLVNNAGYAVYGAVEDTTIEDARRQFEVNLFGLSRLCQLVLPHMRKQKSGKIVNMSSMGGKMYSPLGAWYHATKHALEGWSDCLRLELKLLGIDVVIIEPGIIKTEFAEVMLQPLLDRSGKGAYAGLAQRILKGTQEIYESSLASSPQVIAILVSKAVAAISPKTRYRGGFLSRVSVFTRIYFGDRTWDWIIRRAA